MLYKVMPEGKLKLFCWVVKITNGSRVSRLLRIYSFNMTTLEEAGLFNFSEFIIELYLASQTSGSQTKLKFIYIYLSLV
jgi:hypothetical protein